MRANNDFKHADKPFWATVRSISEAIGYTQKKQVRRYTIDEMRQAMLKLNLTGDFIADDTGVPTELGSTLEAYFTYRANILNTYVEPRLMDAERAAREFEHLRQSLNPTCPLPMNKQRGDKKAPAYLTGIVNMLIEAHANGIPCDYDPRHLTTFTRAGRPLRTLARRVDGCFPSCVNPIAIWEIKEYYYTTTFGSRIADGIYETLLDGLELEEMRRAAGMTAQHLLMVDAYGTWWDRGKSYLCRIIDILNMGYLDEALFGYEVIERLPTLVAQWIGQNRSA